MLRLKLASCMAENSESFCQGVTSFIEDQLGIRSEYVNDIPWQERERRFDNGEIQILWLCGLPYVHKAAWPRTLEMILAGRVDGAAIDSTVLEWSIAGRRDLPEHIRVIESLGPSPIPPWVISKRVAASLRGALALCSCACTWTRVAEACWRAPGSSAWSARATTTTTRFG
jgi:hypothetical protein